MRSATDHLYSPILRGTRAEIAFQHRTGPAGALDPSALIDQQLLIRGERQVSACYTHLIMCALNAHDAIL